jgi:hypothetical protein
VHAAELDWVSNLNHRRLVDGKLLTFEVRAVSLRMRKWVMKHAKEWKMETQ